MDLSSRCVAIDKCADYSPETVNDSFARLVNACEPKYTFRSAQVLLKPNLITARKGTLACTEGAFILAAAKFFRELGAKVSVGDSPAFGSAESVLGAIGILHSLRQHSIPVVEFNRVRSITLPSGVQAGISADALDCDLMVNLPKVKAHAQLRVTMAVKNYFGCICGMRKPMWHMVHGGKPGGLEKLIVELLSVLPDSLTLVDGITAMHVTGPMGGKPYNLGVTACSTNPVGVDRALLAIVGLDPGKSSLMKACSAAGLEGTDIKKLDFPLMSPDDVFAEGFIVPEELIPIRFNPFRFINNNIRRAFLRIGLIK